MPELRPHQRTGTDFLKRVKRVLLADDLRVGKTIQTITAIKEQGYPKALIICPRSLKKQWAEEFNVWHPGYATTILEGTPLKRKEILRNFKEGALIVNYDQVSWNGKAPCPNDFGYIQKLKFPFIGVDESHNMRNRNTKRSKGVKLLAKEKTADSVVLMTGTPIMNKTSELWSQLNILYPKDYSSYWAFIKEHVGQEYNGFAWIEKKGCLDPDKLKNEIAPFTLRRLKEEVFPDLPSVTVKQVMIDLNPEEKTVYDEMQEEWLARVYGQEPKRRRKRNPIIEGALETATPTGEERGNAPIEIEANVLLAQMMRLRQICLSPDLMLMPDNPKEEYEVKHGFHTAKYEWLRELFLSTDEKIVIFTGFEKAARLAVEMLAGEGIEVVRHTGKESEREQTLNKERFKNDPNVRGIVLTITSGGVGLNLTASCLAVFMDKDWTPANNQQAQARLQGMTQPNPVTIYELIARNTIEVEKIESTLDFKKLIVASLVKQAPEKTERIAA